MMIDQQKALSRTLRRILRKNRVKYDGVRYIWNPICKNKGAKIGNDICATPPTNRDRRRIKGAMPELKKKLAITSKACKWKGGFDFSVIDKVIS